jgi:TolB protein
MSIQWKWHSAAAVVAGLLVSTATASAGPVRFEGEGHAETPAWSLDGKYLAFEVNRLAGTIEMFISEVQGDVAGQSRVLKLPGSSGPYGGDSGSVATNATFHPDGIMLFEGSSNTGDYRIFYSKVTGSSPQQFIGTDQLSGKLTFPSLSSDGSQLAFIGSATGAGDLYVRSSADYKITQLTSTSLTELSPLLSADGKRVVYSVRENGAQDLFEMSVSGGSPTMVASGTGDQTRPVYAAGGGVVYFDGARGEGTWDLAMVPSVGGKPVTLARDVVLPTRARPCVTPDGKWVAFAHADPSRDDKIFLVSIDGNTTKEIPTGMKGAGDPAITVKGGRTLLAFTALPADKADWRTLMVMDITDKL